MAEGTYEGRQTCGEGRDLPEKLPASGHIALHALLLQNDVTQLGLRPRAATGRHTL